MKPFRKCNFSNFKRNMEAKKYIYICLFIIKFAVIFLDYFFFTFFDLINLGLTVLNLLVFSQTKVCKKNNSVLAKHHILH